MARVRNVIENQIKTTGAEKASKQVDKVSKSNETLTRNQTRLGQSSASAGRSFSAQANGLGGLVGVYAAAAANVFAITAAFDALGRAAQAEQIVRGTKLLALEIGQNGSQILRNVQEITQAQLTLAESSQNINIALSAGFNTEQIEALSEVSLKASRALGRNLTDAFQRVVRGAAKLEPELLDELGIFTRIDPAVEAYAAKLNIATNSLTNYEKRQAFVNAVIEEGQKKFSAIDTSVDSTQKTFEQLRVALTELALEFGQLVANVLSPVASFFKDNLGSALLLFGGILALVFGRAIQAISGFATASLTKFGQFSDGLARAALESSKNFEIIRQGVRDLDADISQRKGLQQGGGRFAQAGVQREVATGAAQARRRFLAGGASPEQQRQDIKILKQARTQLNNNSAAFKDAGKIIDTYTASQKGATLATRGFGAVARVAGVAARGLGLAISALTASLGVIFSVISAAQLIGTFFDVDVLKEIKEFFVDTSKRAAEFKAGLAGGVSLAGGQRLIDQLKRLGATQEDLEDLPDRIKDIRGELEDTLAGTGGKNLATAIGQRALANTGLKAPEFRELGENIRAVAFFTAALEVEQEKGAKADRQRIAILNSLIEAQNRFGQSQLLAGGIASELGISTEKVLGALEDFITVTDDKTIIQFAGGIDITNKSLQDLADEGVADAVIGLALLQLTLGKAEEAFEKGTATSETLSKQLGGARKTLEELIEAEKEYRAIAGANSPAVIEAQERVKLLDEQVRRLKTLEQVGKALTDTFGKYGAALDKAVQEGKVGLLGVAKTSQEATQNQVAFLLSAIGERKANTEEAKKLNAELGEALKLQEKGVELNSIQVQLVTNRTRALKSISGLVFDTVAAVEKETKAREQQLQKLQSQVEVQQLQNDLQAKQNELAADRASQKARTEQAQARISIAEKQLEIQKLIDESLDNQLSTEREITALLNERARIAADIAEIEARESARSVRFSRERGIRDQESVISDIKAFPNLRSQEQLQEAQRKLIDLNLENELAIIEEKKRQAEQDAVSRRKDLTDQKSLLEAEVFALLIRRAAAKDAATSERNILIARQKLERDKITNEINNLQKQREQNVIQANVVEKQITAQQQDFTRAQKERELTLKTLESQVDLINGLREALGGKSAFVQAIDAFLKEQTGQGVGEKVLTQTFEALDSDFTALKGTFKAITKAEEELIRKRRDGNAANFFAVNARLKSEQAAQRALGKLVERRQALDVRLGLIKEGEARDEITREIDLINTKIGNLDEELNKIDETKTTKLAALDDEATLAQENAEEQRRALLRLKQTIGDLANAISGDLQKSFADFVNTAFDNLASGQKISTGLRDVLVATLDSVRKTVLEETLIKPGQEFIKESIGGLFGLDRGIDDVKLEAGNVPVVVKGTNGSDLVKELTDDSQSAFQDIGDGVAEFGTNAKNTFLNLGNSITNTFSEVGSGIADVAKSIFSEIGSIGGDFISQFGFGSLTGGTADAAGPAVTGASINASPFGGRASGGIIRQMAAGGMLRDRVPALLEPGEFVMKRSAASSIGEPALNRMNSTGSTGDNVVVNINNEGTPQEATSAQPRFDGEKFVIDIVTRDLRNNGPIRKSLRGST